MVFIMTTGTKTPGKAGCGTGSLTTYFNVDVVLAVLDYVGVGSVDGLLMVLYPSRPISRRSEQLQDNSQQQANMSQQSRHHLYRCDEATPKAMITVAESHMVQGRAGSHAEYTLVIAHLHCQHVTAGKNESQLKNCLHPPEPWPSLWASS